MVPRIIILGSALVALLLLLVLAETCPVRAAEAPAPVSPSATVVAHVSLPPAASWMSRLYSSLEAALRDSQKRMVQFCLIGMLLALWVIWWRK